jgi:hypothetical protein
MTSCAEHAMLAVNRVSFTAKEAEVFAFLRPSPSS